MADRNGDGRQELLILDVVGVEWSARKLRLSLLSGGTGEVLSEREFARIRGDGPRLTPLSDLDGDGRAEILLTDHDAFSPGTVLLFSGADMQVFHEGVEGEWIQGLDHFGFSSAALGDVDGDGIEDFAVGAASPWSGRNSRGFVDVYSGKTRTTLHRYFRKDMLGK